LALYRVLEAVGTINKVELGLPAGAVGYRRIGDINLDNPAVPYVDFDRAGRGAHIAYAFFHFYRFVHYGFRSYLGGIVWLDFRSWAAFIIAGRIYLTKIIASGRLFIKINYQPSRHLLFYLTLP
jgi:hypothetical protein